MTITNAMFSIRPLLEQDFDRWLDLRNQSFPWPVDRARFLFEDSLRPADEPILRLGAWTDTGELVGTAECYLGEDGERYIDRGEAFLMVAETQRRQGLGTLLAEQVERFVREQRLGRLEALCYGRELPHARPFLIGRGFKELERFQESWQEPSAIPLDHLETLRGDLRRAGIETAPFSAMDSPAMRQALYRCAMAIQRDMPHEPQHQWEDPPFETWIRKVFQAPGASANAMFAARDGDQIVGLTYLVERDNADAEVGDTGVVRTHRRRGIARVLKMMATRYAAQHGIRRVQTDNRTDNAGMLAINRELGFKPGELILMFEKTLGQ